MLFTPSLYKSLKHEGEKGTSKLRFGGEIKIIKIFYVNESLYLTTRSLSSHTIKILLLCFRFENIQFK